MLRTEECHEIDVLGMMEDVDVRDELVVNTRGIGDESYTFAFEYLLNPCCFSTSMPVVTLRACPGSRPAGGNQQHGCFVIIVLFIDFLLL